MLNKIACILGCLASVLAAGCANVPESIESYIPIITQFGVYKLDINQGNYVTQDMAIQLLKAEEEHLVLFKGFLKEYTQS